MCRWHPKSSSICNSPLKGINFSAISSESLLGSILRLPLRLIPPAAVVPILQSRIRGKKWIAGSGLAGYWLGSYELDIRIMFEQIVKQGMVVYDIGAHVGFYTLLAAELVGREGQVFAFEPLPRNLSFLERHIRLNRVSNTTIIPMAVTYKTGEALFSDPKENTEGKISKHGSHVVPVISLDDFVFIQKYRAPDILKIDVEGEEYNVILGARKTLQVYHPAIFLSTHSESICTLCQEVLINLGYSLQNFTKHTYLGADLIFLARHTPNECAYY